MKKKIQYIILCQVFIFFIKYDIIKNMKNDNLKKITIKNNKSSRVDSLIKKKFPHISRSEIDLICKLNRVYSHTRTLKKGDMLESDITVLLTDNQKSGTIFRNSSIKPNIVYEDDYILFVEKPASMPTVANNFLDDDSLANYVASYTKILNVGETLNGGSINRLDNQTSGLVLFAKTNEAYQTLYENYHDTDSKSKVEKYYIAVVHNKKMSFPNYILMEDNIKKITNTKMDTTTNEGIYAFSEASVIGCYGNYTVLLVRLFTGIRHQIRLQLSSRGFPIIGDSLYGENEENSRLMLHSYMMCIVHPVTNEKITVASNFDFVNNEV